MRGVDKQAQVSWRIREERMCAYRYVLVLLVLLAKVPKVVCVVSQVRCQEQVFWCGCVRAYGSSDGRR